MVICIRVAWEFSHSVFVREPNDSVSVDSSSFGHTRSPVRNGASRKQPLIVSCHNWF
jgi:hypothetical protein